MIDIKSGYLLPWQFRLAALLASVLAIAIIQHQPWLAVVLIFGATFSLTSYEGTEIDTVHKKYREYTAWFFIKTGDFENFTEAERIFITQGKESQQLYTAHTTHSSTFENVVYHAYLKFSDTEKLHLLSTKSKPDLILKTEPLSKALKVEVVDYTETGN